jgi:transposase
MLIRERRVVDTVRGVAARRAGAMRGSDGMQEALFTLAKLEDFVPADHPLRAIRALVNEALAGLNGLFNAIYADSGGASVAPEKLLRAMLIQVLFSVRSERQLMEQIRYTIAD